eukprot:TRINITY_DN25852_c0_g1_i1.p1 TRINITY_DN25852_c0_g1~~TRINITY_DN25852_c0_g1_i1.p1  ORF type:complete len:155 (-),score=22.89 TRINITY_DN25852_c0_g1_i1:64-528(-)
MSTDAATGSQSFTAGGKESKGLGIPGRPRTALGRGSSLSVIPEHACGESSSDTDQAREDAPEDYRYSPHSIAKAGGSIVDSVQWTEEYASTLEFCMNVKLCMDGQGQEPMRMHLPSLDSAIKPESRAKLFCPWCGSKRASESSMFCTSCGTKLT